MRLLPILDRCIRFAKKRPAQRLPSSGIPIILSFSVSYTSRNEGNNSSRLSCDVKPIQIDRYGAWIYSLSH